MYDFGKPLGFDSCGGKTGVGAGFYYYYYSCTSGEEAAPTFDVARMTWNVGPVGPFGQYNNHGRT
jgi:hypothetical protein